MFFFFARRADLLGKVLAIGGRVLIYIVGAVGAVIGVVWIVIVASVVGIALGSVASWFGTFFCARWPVSLQLKHASFFMRLVCSSALRMSMSIALGSLSCR